MTGGQMRAGTDLIELPVSVPCSHGGRTWPSGC